jgi:hypothetical protein
VARVLGDTFRIIGDMIICSNAGGVRLFHRYDIPVVW